jgi:hypothetical protein
VNTPHEIWMTRAILCSVRKELPLRNSKFRGNCNRECGVVSPSLAKEGRGTIFNAEKLFSNQHVLFCHCIVFFQLVTWEHTFRNNGLSPCTVTRSEFCNSTRSLIRLPHPPRTSLRPSMPPGCTENSTLSLFPNPPPTHLNKSHLRSRAPSRPHAIPLPNPETSSHPRTIIYRTRCQSKY